MRHIAPSQGPITFNHQLDWPAANTVFRISIANKGMVGWYPTGIPERSSGGNGEVVFRKNI